MKQFRFTAELTPEDDGRVSVYCPELDVSSFGDTEAEALINIREAAELHLESLKELDGLGIPVKSRRVTIKEIEVCADV